MKKYIGNIVCLSNNINRELVSCFGWSDFGVIYWSGDFTEDSTGHQIYIALYGILGGKTEPNNSNDSHQKGMLFTWFIRGQTLVNIN